MSDTEIVYQERPGKPKLWLGVPWTLCAVLLIWSFGEAWVQDHELPIDAMLVLTPLFFGIASIPGLVSLSKRRYNAITLTPRTLRVGRHTLPVADITLHPPATSRAARLLGGGYDVPVGMHAVELGGRGGERYVVAVMNPQAFLAALTQVIAKA
ncbi:hypothetical protein OHB01_16660 [Microbispora hainanensis]|uniref:PH domain-containing protein n=1 Tax=Microbispora hainanensis TaxID=568844 RepID=A0ABZ1SH22_9ACTN|nr:MULTISPECIES: hypothetical protein [Microbispora]NJP24249.1 hypothetical protein [Microbispora sp. CL1-1]TQS15047.1 hypothetical protein FLW53_08575 [Microbispora sp. SCL1-1]